MKKPSSLRNTVCLIGELLRIHLIKILQLLLFQNLRMEGGNTVYRMSSYNRKVRHLNLSVVDDCHFRNFSLCLIRIFSSDFFAKTTIDFFHDLINTGKELREELDRPLFKSLRHDGMVRVSAGIYGNLLCLIPCQMIIVHEDAHKLRNRYCWMGVI